jgi:YVTN family beta-propeller protein
MTARLATALFVLLAAAVPAGAGSVVSFESGQVRPLALSPDGSRLFAVNTPDGRLEVFTVDAGGLVPAVSVPVGLEPVSVAVRSDQEVWVVNHLSDSVSVVDVGATPPRVTRTLLVGDEPRDVVFAGPGHQRAFVTTAHRGQHARVDPQLTVPGVGRADVWVFDAAQATDDPLAIVTLFGDTPRALAATPDGATVYAAVFQSGNQTTIVGEGSVCDGGPAATCEVDGLTMPGGLPAPTANVEGVPGPEVGLIVKFDPLTGGWRDPIGRDWRNAIRLTLPDADVFAIDAMATPPVAIASFAHVGTVIYGLAVNPASGALYASNTEAHNEVRFSGAGTLGGSSVRGHLHESRITVVDAGGVRPVHLNPHIDYGTVPSPAGTKERSLATPTGMAVSGDGATLYVAALGSSKVAILDTAALEAGHVVPDPATHVVVPGGGPTGLVLDEPRGRLYVLARFANTIAVLDPAARSALQVVALHDPEPASVGAGRPVLYDATIGSSNGEQACATCHVFGDADGLAWDLGDPDGPVVPDPNPIRSATQTTAPDFHPLKGPLTTQTLRGLATQGAMHWRGDRTGGLDPGVDPRDERAAFLQFNAAFADLMGREGPLPPEQMEAFADFVLQLTPPPNPVRALDNSLTPVQQQGRDLFTACRESCHVIDPAQGFFGTDGFVATTGTNPTQVMKIPHLDGFYTKVGMFMMPPPFNLGATPFIGDQVRGFGFTHDGSVGFYNGNPEIEQYLLAFDNRLAPIVGQQTTLDGGNTAASGPRLDLLVARAAAGECDLTAKGVVAGEERGWVRGADGAFDSDRAAEAPASESALRAQAAVPGQQLTYTCVPPGSGMRVGIDRDEDGFLDRDERDAGSDPADAASTPFLCTAPAVERAKLVRTGGGAPETLVARGEAALGTPIDPAASGLRLRITDAAGGMLFDGRLAPGTPGWRSNRSATRWRFTDPAGRAATGITRATVRDRAGAAPGVLAFKLVARTAVPGAADPPLPLRFAVGVGAAPADRCAVTAFPPDACTLRGGGRAATCR